MFCKGISIRFLNKSYAGRTLSQIYSHQTLKSSALQTSLSNNFSTTSVDFINEKNPRINNTSNAISINWQSAKTGKSIIGIMTKYSIPNKIENKHFFQIQQQLYIALVRLQENELQKKVYDSFIVLHNEAIANLAKLKTQSQYKNDILFNNFCVALFQGQKILHQRGYPGSSRIQSNLTFLQSLLQDKFPHPTFYNEILPFLNIEELKECCNILLQANQVDLVFRIISTPHQYLPIEFKAELEKDFYSIIHAKQISSLHNLQQYFEYHSQIALSQHQNIQNQYEVNKSKDLSLQAIDVLFRTIKASKNLGPSIPKIKHIFQLIQLSGFQIKKNQVDLLNSLLNKSQKGNDSQRQQIYELIEQLELLPYEEGERDEIQQMLLNAKKAHLEQISNDKFVGKKEMTSSQIQDISQQLVGVSRQVEIEQHQSFITLQNIVDQSVQIAQIVNIITILSKNNIIAASVLAKDKQTLIEENIQFLKPQEFSQIIAINDRAIHIPFDLMVKYTQSNYQEFSIMLLVQSFYMLCRKKQYNQSAEEMKLKIQQIIINKKEELKYEQLNLLAKTLQFLKESDSYLIQNIIEFQVKSQLESDSRIFNVYFSIVQHKILKEGIQANFVNSQLEIIEGIIKSDKIDLKQIDLFNFSLLITAINKFTNSNIIYDCFLKRVKMQAYKPRPDQLVYIYIALIQCSFRLQNADMEEVLKNYEKNILNEIQMNKSNQPSITLVQLAKLMHELVRIYNNLDPQRIQFLDKIYDRIIKSYNIQNDIGLSIWILWQQTLVCNDINKFIQLFNLVRNNVDKIVSFENEKEEYQTIKFKQYNRDMKQKIQEIQVVQLCQSLKYYEVNKNLFMKDKKFDEEIEKIKDRMSNNKSITGFQKVVTVKNVSHFEKSIQNLLDIVIEKENLKYKVTAEKQIEKIFFLDYYIEELKLGIECNGNQHYIGDKMYFTEIIRNAYLQKKGYFIEVLRTSDFNDLPIKLKEETLSGIIHKYEK